MIWLYLLLCTLIVVLSAAANAVADIIEHPDTFYASVFSKRDPKFWLKTESHKYAKKVFTYKIDAWHLVESFQVLLFIGAIILPAIWLPVELYSWEWWAVMIVYGILGFSYNIAFVKIYKRLKRKPDANN